VSGAVLATLLAVAAGSLPEPPRRVKYVVEKGDVVFDHAAHVARRETCASCHGEGAVRKVEVDRRFGHVTCVGCHAIRRAGPKGCTGCHDDA
jgi:hypothetical protein